MNRSLTFFLLALMCAACVRQDPAEIRGQYVLLVADWRSNAIHRIALDGTYEGDFLDPGRFENSRLRQRAWSSPRGLFFFDDTPSKLWMVAERSLSEWSPAGAHVRTILSDSAHIEDPSAIVRAGDEIFVISEDKKIMLVFDLDGRLVRKFGYPELYRAKDMTVGPDGMIYVGSGLRSPQKGLVTAWDPNETDIEAKPLAYHVPPDVGEDGTLSVHSLAFDKSGDLLTTDFNRGRVERWDLETDTRLEVLLDGETHGAYLEIRSGPDGLVYLSGRDGIYRFDSLAIAAELADISPFFRADAVQDVQETPFAPSYMVFVKRAALATP